MKEKNELIKWLESSVVGVCLKCRHRSSMCMTQYILGEPKRIGMNVESNLTMQFPDNCPRVKDSIEV